MHDIGLIPDLIRIQIFHLVVHTANFEVRYFIHLVQVILKCLFYILLGDFILHQFVFKFLEERGFIIAQFRFQPVFGIKEYLPIGFPYAVILHPLPLRPGIRRRNIILFSLSDFDISVFQIQETALHKKLD